ncbi:unnamed protein product [Mesocestoides corti]|uniref:Uncharacterized protein n=2 Tax=Mesocestoides corti TaxID=53468 RepID=A0A0R3UCF4_MESCO|nr:unnamed protein product [Mesocestoides corti]
MLVAFESRCKPVLLANLSSSVYRPQTLMPTATTAATTTGVLGDTEGPAHHLACAMSLAKQSAFSRPTPQSPVLHSSPFANPLNDLERLALGQELEETREKLHLVSSAATPQNPPVR